MTIKNKIFLLTIILLTSLFLRLYKLYSRPVGFHVDEVKVGWNAYSLYKTGRDDWGHAFPIHYNTFGDYRPTGYFYTTVLPVSILGLNEFAVRFSPAVFGVLAVFFTFVFVYYLTLNSRLALLSSFFLTFSPWQISLSRASSEGIISMCLVIAGLAFLVRYVRRPTRSSLFLSIIFFSLSYFFYHSSRLLNPFFALVTIIYFHRRLNYFPNKAYLVPMVLLVLSGLYFLNPQAKGRFNQVSLTSQNSAPITTPMRRRDRLKLFIQKIDQYTPKVINEYSKYFSSNFYISPLEAKPLRYATLDTGLVLYLEFGLLVFGLIQTIKGKFSTLPLLILLLAPLPAALTWEDSPNLHRAMFISPIVAILTAFGLYSLSKRRVLTLLIIFLFFINFSGFWHRYHYENSTAKEIITTRNAGYTELIQNLPQLQKQYRNVILSDSPDHLYPWYAFYNQPNPKVFNEFVKNRNHKPFIWENLIFTPFECPSEVLKMIDSIETVAVDIDRCVQPGLRLVGKIDRSNQTSAFTFWTINPK